MGRKKIQRANYALNYILNVLYYLYMKFKNFYQGKRKIEHIKCIFLATITAGFYHINYKTPSN